MLKWAIELSEYRIKYQPRLSWKRQVMADFITELPKKQAHPTDHLGEQRRSFGGSYLKCLSELDTKYVLFELHEGACGNHPGEHTLAHRAYTQGYYWPTMK
ncbi:hypothetical protein AAG906_013735 [Vitis piasezkii]